MAVSHFGTIDMNSFEIIRILPTLITCTVRSIPLCKTTMVANQKLASYGMIRFVLGCD